jgi:hypothetical protein
VNAWNRAEWRAWPCDCRGCHVCGMHGQARRPDPPPKPEPMPEPVPTEPEKPTQPNLFDEVPT